jgi:multidrug efflux pump subunit AcrA (membrane-fusion protein)
VFVYDRAASRVRRLYIRVGALYGNRVEVVEGLSPGTEVVTDGAVFIQNGDRVRLAPAPDRSEPNAS